MVAKPINPPGFVNSSLVGAIDRRFPECKSFQKIMDFSFDKKTGRYSCDVNLLRESGISMLGSLWVCEYVDIRESTCSWRCTRDWMD